jgi:hypothetical protein
MLVPKKQNWMPVFVVVPAAITMHAAHPKHRGKIPKGPQVDGSDFEQRIGTAMRQKDGSYSVQLTAMPMNGKLLIRPARRGDYCNPTRQES